MPHPPWRGEVSGSRHGWRWRRAVMPPTPRWGKVSRLGRAVTAAATGRGEVRGRRRPSPAGRRQIRVLPLLHLCGLRGDGDVGHGPPTAVLAVDADGGRLVVGLLLRELRVAAAVVGDGLEVEERRGRVGGTRGRSDIVVVDDAQGAGGQLGAAALLRALGGGGGGRRGVGLGQVPLEVIGTAGNGHGWERGTSVIRDQRAQAWGTSTAWCAALRCAPRQCGRPRDMPSPRTAPRSRRRVLVVGRSMKPRTRSPSRYDVSEVDEGIGTWHCTF